MSANFDNSAWFYDRLSKVVYGKALVQSQAYLLNHISENSTILIAGGGTGWILEEITKIYSSGLTITYVEVSAKMMKKSRRRYTGKHNVTFINRAVEEIEVDIIYDIVITPFLFDNFTEYTLQSVFDCIDRNIKSNGLWLNTNFRLTGKWWQKFLLTSMLLFFRIICGIEAKRLPNIMKQFADHRYKLVDQKSFFGEFILSAAYKKIG